MNPHGNDHRHPPGDELREEELRRLFTERERRDEASAPGYERLRRRPAGLARPARAASQRWWAAPTSWAAAGAVLALIVLMVLWRVQPGARPTAPLPYPEPPTLETWRAPTDFLLSVPGGELLDSTPALPDPNLPVLPSGS